MGCSCSGQLGRKVWPFNHDGSNTVWRTILWIAPDRGIAYLAAANASDILANDDILQVLDTIIASLINETDTVGEP